MLFGEVMLFFAMLVSIYTVDGHQHGWKMRQTWTDSESTIPFPISTKNNHHNARFELKCLEQQKRKLHVHCTHGPVLIFIYA